MKRVYFIKPVGMDGPIKIGCSVSPDGRVRTLRTWCPLPLELLATIDGDDVLERRFHALFLHLHKGHEWFEPDAELLAAIAQIRRGVFDVGQLPEPISLRKRRGKAKPERRDPNACGRINRLGGTTAVARKLGIPITTVQQWKDSGIPAGRKSQIDALEAA